MKFIVALDSFKGSLTSQESGEAVAAGIRNILPDSDVRLFSLSDGGEGTAQILTAATGGVTVRLTAHDPLMRPVEASYGLSSDGTTAYIDVASVCGLPLLSPDERNPLNTTSYGVGELMLDALGRGVSRFIIGLGGSATNDAGMGLLSALGFRFCDSSGVALQGRGEDLERVCRVEIEEVSAEWRTCEVIALCDVENPLYGPSGAACVYAPQKGADPRSVGRLDNGLRVMARVMEEFAGRGVALHPGAGAAGGIGAGLMAFLRGELRSGIQTVLQLVGFEAALTGADCVFTGEGRADRQTLNGKLPWGVLRLARSHRLPVVLLSGEVRDRAQLERAGFTASYAIVRPGVERKQAMEPAFAKERLTHLAEQALREIFKI